MTYLIVENGIIANIIVADEAFANSIGAMPYYEGASIGSMYSPPSTEKDLLDLLIDQGIRLKKLELGVS